MARTEEGGSVRARPSSRIDHTIIGTRRTGIEGLGLYGRLRSQSNETVGFTREPAYAGTRTRTSSARTRGRTRSSSSRGDASRQVLRSIWTVSPTPSARPKRSRSPGTVSSRRCGRQEDEHMRAVIPNGGECVPLERPAEEGLGGSGREGAGVYNDPPHPLRAPHRSKDAPSRAREGCPIRHARVQRAATSLHLRLRRRASTREKQSPRTGSPGGGLSC